MLAVNELASNSLDHGGGRGEVRLWSDGTTFLVEVEDSGSIVDLLVGRTSPTARPAAGPWGVDGQPAVRPRADPVLGGRHRGPGAQPPRERTGPVTLADVAVELYALPPAEFTAARNARAKQVRAAGDRELAGQVGALRKPTLAAWAVDLLVRQRPDQVEDLLALGARLLEAQAARAGDALRDLNRQQHAAMAALRAEARRLAADAGQRLGDAVDVPLESTLRAAMTDPAAAAAVRSGLLVADLVSTGFGPVEVGDAVAVPDAPPLTTSAPDRPAGGEPADDDSPAVPLPRRRSATGPRAATDRPAPELQIRLRAARGARGAPPSAPSRAHRAPGPDEPTVPAADAGSEEAAEVRGPALRRDDERAAARRAKQEREQAARDEAHRREREEAEHDLAAARERAEAADRQLSDAEAAVQDAAERRAALEAEVERLEDELAEARDRRDTARRQERQTSTARDAAARAASTAARRAAAAEERLDAVR